MNNLMTMIIPGIWHKFMSKRKTCTFWWKICIFLWTSFLFSVTKSMKMGDNDEYDLNDYEKYLGPLDASDIFHDDCPQAVRSMKTYFYCVFLNALFKKDFCLKSSRYLMCIFLSFHI